MTSLHSLPAINHVKSIDEFRSVIRRLPDKSVFSLVEMLREHLDQAIAEVDRRMDDGFTIPGRKQ